MSAARGPLRATQITFFANQSDRPSWPGGVARSAGVVGQAVIVQIVDLLLELDPPPRLRLRRSHPSWPGGAIGLICNV